MAVPGTQGALPVAREFPRTQSNLLIHTPSQALELDTQEDGQGGGMVTQELSVHTFSDWAAKTAKGTLNPAWGVGKLLQAYSLIKLDRRINGSQ